MGPTTHFAPTPEKLSRSRFDQTSVVSVTALAGVPEFVRDAFGEHVLRQANHAAMLDIEAIEDQNCFIPHITMTTFVDAIARLSGEELFGLTVAPHLSVGSKGCWGAYMLEAPTLGAAIERGAATIGFHSNGDVLSATAEDDAVRLSYASPAKGHDGYLHAACGTAGILLSICRSFLPEHWRPLRVEFDIARPANPGAFEDTFGCPVVFDAPAVSVCLEADLLDSPPRRPRARALITAGDVARARLEWATLDSLRGIVEQQVWSQLLTGSASIESAARSLDTSVRTLQRELNREGTDFRSLVNAVRARRSIELLRDTDASITEISTALGYSAPAHFARSFRRATGLSPSEFREHSARTAAA